MRATKRAPASTFEASVGYGWITSKLYDVNRRVLGKKAGWNGSWLTNTLGVVVWEGVQYSGFKVSFPTGDMLLSYIAPEWVMRYR